MLLQHQKVYGVSCVGKQLYFLNALQVKFKKNFVYYLKLLVDIWLRRRKNNMKNVRQNGWYLPGNLSTQPHNSLRYLEFLLSSGTNVTKY